MTCKEDYQYQKELLRLKDRLKEENKSLYRYTDQPPTFITPNIDPEKWIKDFWEQTTETEKDIE